MGRHAAPDASYYRSVGRAVLRSLVVVAMVAGATVALSRIGAPSDAPVIVLGPARSAAPGPAVTSPTPDTTSLAATRPTATAPPTGTPAETGTPRVAPTATSRPTPTATPRSAVDAPPPEDTSVQVLDSGAGPARTQQVVALLRDLGYRVVAVNQGRCCYEQTTVFYSRNRRPAAEALRERDPRFGVVGANPNLDQTVHIHVVVGEDWTP